MGNTIYYVTSLSNQVVKGGGRGQRKTKKWNAMRCSTFHNDHSRPGLSQSPQRSHNSPHLAREGSVRVLFCVFVTLQSGRSRSLCDISEQCTINEAHRFLKYLSNVSHKLPRVELGHTEKVRAVGLVDAEQREVQGRRQLLTRTHETYYQEKQ